MAVVRKTQKERMPLIDDDVEALVRNNPIYGEYAKGRTMTASRRRKKLREEERTKATYDLPSETMKYIESIAKQESVTYSQLANTFLVYAINDYLRDKVHFDKKILTRSPRYEYQIIPPVIKNPGKGEYTT
jgi:hypothetical protein